MLQGGFGGVPSTPKPEMSRTGGDEFHLGGRLSRLLRPTRCAVPSSKFLFSYGATPLPNLLIEPTRHGISRYARERRLSVSCRFSV